VISMVDVHLVQSVERAMRVLEVLGASEVSLPLSTIAKQAGIPVSTAHRLLASMKAHGFVRYESDDRTYGVGLAVLSLAEAAKAQIRIQTEAQPILQRLASQLNETATLVLVNDRTGTYASTARSSRSMVTTARLGEQVPLHATAAGKIILAYLPEKALREDLGLRLEAFTSNTFTNLYQLRDELARVRTNGVAFDNEEREKGMRCIAAPVFDNRGRVCATIGISGPSSRISIEPESESSKYVRAAAQQLSTALGYMGVHRFEQKDDPDC
jgi:DNA-binding IclR family transcriptional regulator